LVQQILVSNNQD